MRKSTPYGESNRNDKVNNALKEMSKNKLQMLKIEEAENTTRRATNHNLKKNTLKDKLHKPQKIPRVITWALEGLADPVPNVTTVIHVQIYHVVNFQFLSKIFFTRVKIRKSFCFELSTALSFKKENIDSA